jgi:sirohydrochlorin cobaltochelatase
VAETGENRGENRPAAALLLAGHGSSQHPAGSRAVRDHAAKIRDRGLFAEVGVAFWKEAPGLHTALQTLASDEVYVVPVLASRGHITETVLPRELGLSGPVRHGGWEVDGRRIYLCDPVGLHPDLPAAVAREVAAVCDHEGLEPQATTVLLVGHGNSRNPVSATQTEDVANAVAALPPFAALRTAFLENPPFMEDWRRIVHGDTLLVMPYMIAGGLHAAQDVPELLGIDPDEPDVRRLLDDGLWAGPYSRDGRRIWLSRPVGSFPFIADMIIDQAAAAGAPARPSRSG